MNKSRLIEVAKDEMMPDNFVIRGYCSVDDDLSVTCTRDSYYGGRIDDCVHSSSTTKSKCQHWKRVDATPINSGAANE